MEAPQQIKGQVQSDSPTFNLHSSHLDARRLNFNFYHLCPFGFCLKCWQPSSSSSSSNFSVNFSSFCVPSHLLHTYTPTLMWVCVCVCVIKKLHTFKRIYIQNWVLRRGCLVWEWTKAWSIASLFDTFWLSCQLNMSHWHQLQSWKHFKT